MAKRRIKQPNHSTVELDGRAYVMLRREAFVRLCKAAGVAGVEEKSPRMSGGLAPFEVDRATLAQRLRRRRMDAGLGQAELARLAGVRPETLNRIERGRTDPDFSTIRKLVSTVDRALAASA